MSGMEFGAWKWREILLEQSIHFLKLYSSCKCFGPLTASSPCEESHYDHHDWQSHTEHDAADGQFYWTPHGGWISQILGSGMIFKQKGCREVQKRHPAVFCGRHLTPQLPVLVFPLELCDQSGVAASAPNQLVPAQRRGRQRNMTQLLFISTTLLFLSYFLIVNKFPIQTVNLQQVLCLYSKHDTSSSSEP